MISELSREDIDDLLRAQVVGRVGCHADGLTYVVPVIYAYDGAAFYVLTVDGQKVRMMRENPQVCFEVDEYENGSWRSAIAYGRYEELAGADADRAVALLVERFAGRGGERRRPEGGDRPTVAFRIAIESVTGRAVVR